MNLPSREEFRRMELGEGHGYAQARDAVVDAFQSGRLVDREAIDYATATKVLASLVGPDAHPRRDEVVRAVIAAAIGDTE